MGTRRATWTGLAAVAAVVALAFAWLTDRGGAEGTAPAVAEHAAVLDADGAAPDVVARENAPSPDTPASDAAPLALDGLVEPTLSGRVVDEDGAPIPGATVRAARAWIETSRPAGRFMERAVFAHQITGRWETTCDTDGRWALVLPDDVGEGPRRPSGYDDVLLCYDAPGHRRFVTRWSGDAAVGQVELARGAWVVGRVVDEVGAPVAGARVWVDDRTFNFRGMSWPPVEGWTSVTTDAGGRFATAPCHPKSVTLTIEARCRLHERRVKTLDLGANDVGDLVVWRGGTVTGTVRDPDGKPVAGARVFVSGHHLLGHDAGAEIDVALDTHRQIIEWHDHAAVVTDARGAFTLHGVDTRELWVSAAAPPLGLAPRRVTLTVGRADVELVLPDDRPALAVDVVAAEDGRPLDLEDVEFTATAVTRTFGESRNHEGHPAHVLRASGGRVVLWSPSTIGTDLSFETPGRHPASLFVPAGQASVTVALEPGVVIEGRVVDRAPRGALTVSAVRSDGEARDWTYVHPDDTFRLAPLTPGRWYVTAQQNERAASTVVDAREPGVVSDVELVMRGTGALHVDVEPETSRAFGFIAESTASLRTVTTSKRTFHDLAPGTWTVSAEGIAPVTAEVVAGETTTVTAKGLERPRVTGYVTRGGRPVTTGRVLLDDLAADVRPDGSYEYVALREDDRVISWRDEGACWVDDDLVPLRWGETVRRDLEIGEHVDVEVTVVDELTGAPVPGAPVVAEFTLTDRMELGRTDADGRLRAGPLRGEGLTLEIDDRRGDFALASAHPEPAAGAGVVAVELRTRATGTLEYTAGDTGRTVDDELSVVVRLESTTRAEVLRFDARAEATLSRVPVGTWRLVVVPAWRDVDAVPRGAGELVEIRHGERTSVTVPLTY